MGEIRIGTSGWSYPSGPGAWKGIFYPAGSGGGRRLDELSYYAEHFDTVEVNSSFYRPPDPATARRWAERTPAGFDFSLKLFQKFTHPAMYKKATSPGLPAEDAAGAIPAVTRVDVDGFKAAIDPLANAGKLGALLAQFPPGFHRSDDAREYLAWLLLAFKDYPVAVELRHRSWSDHMGETLTLVNSYRACWAQIDEPKFRFSIQQNHLPNLRSLYYMRLHGRNADNWWKHDHPDERYDYLYSAGEIDSFAETVTTVRRLVHKIYVYLNNHFAGKSVANAAALRHKVGQPVPGWYSDEMLARYPFLGKITRWDAGGTLFDNGDEREGPQEKPAEDAEPQEG
ncbi:MAG: DUF72 domain-containing protein [Acidobacteria bacterium]|nr:DUF72 domain-containing protein [Acidobacteriota bacterium]